MREILYILILIQCEYLGLHEVGVYGLKKYTHTHTHGSYTQTLFIYNGLIDL